MKDTELGFEEKRGLFINSPEDRDCGPRSANELYVAVRMGHRNVAQIRANGNVTYGEHQPNAVVRCITLTPAQRREIDRKADEFRRKCDVDGVVAECVATIARMLEQVPMIPERPLEAPVQFADDAKYVHLRKGESYIGKMKKQGLERGKLFLFYQLQRTGLSEADKMAILEKCREVMLASE